MVGPEPQTWFNGAVAIITGLLGFIVNSFHGTQKKQGLDIEALTSRGFVTRDELQKYLDQVRSDRIQMHVENLSRLDRIDDALVRVHSRIDERMNK